VLLLITCDGPHAKDFGYLVHKHPDSLFERELWFGKLSVFYPENREERATIALLVDVDPVRLVRGENRAAALEQYVNDRPFVASSLTSVALREAFSSALAGRCKDRPQLVDERLPLRARVPAVRARGGRALVHKLFEPLGYQVDVTLHPLDPRFPGWGDSSLLSFDLAGQQTVHDLLSHLYVLLPVLDAEKHYFVGDDEVGKLLEHGAGWLAGHPEKLLISSRYLRYRGSLVRQAMSQLTLGLPEQDEEAQAGEDSIESQVSLNDQRLAAVLAALGGAEPPIRRVVDMGCGEGRLVRALVDDRSLSEIVGVDVSSVALELAERRLDLERRPAPVRERVKLLQGSLLYRDARLHDYDAMTLVEVIEHIEEERLDVVRKVVFAEARPRRVVITTPNAEYNARFATLPAGQWRHSDHRFEWTRAQFRGFCDAAASTHGYAVRYGEIGPIDAELGAPTQMAVFDREVQP
jgi:3' terminal RNA ribose 2'-O-methyltransferase Hen1